MNNDIRLKKLHFYEIPGVAHNLLRSFLQDRRQLVIINYIPSSTDNITSGDYSKAQFSAPYCVCHLLQIFGK